MQNELMKILSNISKSANCHLFNDCSGDSISRRTARGLNRQLSGSNNNIVVSSDLHLTHALMLSSYFLIKSKNNTAKTFGALVVASLFTSYHAGLEI
jgi:hypothetical protein